MRLHAKHYLTGMALLALAIPASARTLKQTLILTTSETIGSTQLKPATYDITADDTKMELNILQKGKIIATIPGQWVKIPQKSVSSSVVSTGDKITEIQFGGSDQVFQPR
jgi:hypothetical protein